MTYNYETYFSEILLKYNPKYHNQQCKDAVSLEITVLLNRKAFVHVPTSKIALYANVLGGRVINAITNPLHAPNKNVTNQQMYQKDTKIKKRLSHIYL